MAIHVQLDLKAIEQAPSASGAEGIGFRDHLAGLVLMYHHVWTKKSDVATRELLMGWFAVGPDEVRRLAAGLVAFGHLEVRGEGWRIKGTSRYENLRKAFSEGGKKASGNLRQFSGAQKAPVSTSSSASGPAAPSTPAPGKKGTAPSAEELACWDVMERLRVDHCVALELEPGASAPLRTNKVLKAVMAVRIADVELSDGETLSRWDLLTLLFERYLAQERIGLKDKEGNACTPLWPIDLFLSPGVLERFKQDYDAEAAA